MAVVSFFVEKWTAYGIMYAEKLYTLAKKRINMRNILWFIHLFLIN